MSPRRSSLSPTYAAMDVPLVPDPDSVPSTLKQQGRPLGSKNKPKELVKLKRNIPWYQIFWSACWWIVATISVVSFYRGVQGWLGQSAAYIALSVSVVVATFLLSRFGVRMRESA